MHKLNINESFCEFKLFYEEEDDRVDDMEFFKSYKMYLWPGFYIKDR